MHHVEQWHDPEWLRAQHQRLDDKGLLDPDQPTAYSHAAHVAEREAEFTPLERRMLRARSEEG